MILSNLGLGFDYFLMALAPNLWFLFAGRLISGITSASVSTAGAYIADVASPEKRAAMFGMLGAAFGLGFTIGPAIGGLLGDIDLRLPFWGAGALSLINGVYGFFVLPEIAGPKPRAPVLVAGRKHGWLLAAFDLGFKTDPSVIGRVFAALCPRFIAQHVRAVRRVSLQLESRSGRFRAGGGWHFADNCIPVD